MMPPQAPGGSGTQPPGGGGAPARRRHRRLTALVAVAVLLAAGVATSIREAHRYYEFAPGDAPTVTASAACQLRDGASGALSLPGGRPCARLVVPTGRAHAVAGELLMVDVLVGPASPVDWALDQLHLLGVVHPSNQLVPAAEVLGSTPPSQLGCQDAAQMLGSTEAAAVAALARLGHPATLERLGAQVAQVVGGSPAAAAGVHCNDVITALDGAPVTTAAGLVSAIRARHPGDRVALTVRRTTGAGTTTPVLHATLAGSPSRPSEAFLGVATADDTTYRLPFPVSIQVGDIGGPSAGLALTLGLLDVLSAGHLTGGHTVAATGTISPDGTVGDVGGVAQKTVAVHDAGAQLFLVPPQELATARAHAGGMRVEAVSSLDQALADLQAIGGRIPPATAAPSTVAAPGTAGP